MKIDNVTYKAVNACIENHIPFALFAPPGEKEGVFYACRPDEEGCCRWNDADTGADSFFINFFANDEEYTAGIRREMNARQLLEYAPTHRTGDLIEQARFQHRSTERLNYIASVSMLIKRLKRDHRKTVISRLEVVDTERRVLDVALDYFASFPSTFRYLCYTPETGMWLGATPEVVLSYEHATHACRAMALAGTRPSEMSGPWDAKNIEEHKFVVGHIYACLAQNGASDIEMSHRDLVYGPVTHLCTDLTARMEIPHIREFLTDMSPTPAVAGFPVMDAIRDIFTTELHERLCYGGFVGYNTASQLQAFANLRCAHASEAPIGGSSFNVYSGGGITGDSVAADEWDEAVNKVKMLNKAITQ